jgi:hypothetical protein
MDGLVSALAVVGADTVALPDPAGALPGPLPSPTAGAVPAVACVGAVTVTPLPAGALLEGDWTDTTGAVWTFAPVGAVTLAALLDGAPPVEDVWVDAVGAV